MKTEEFLERVTAKNVIKWTGVIFVVILEILIVITLIVLMVKGLK